MRYLLLPVTMFIWFIIPYFIIYATPILMGLIFPLSWLWLIVILVASGFFLNLFAITQIKFGLILGKFYKHNRIVAYLHILSGVVGIVFMTGFHFLNPTYLEIDGMDVFILKAFWDISRFKTIVVSLLILGYIFAVVLSTYISYMGFQENFSDSEDVQDDTYA